MSINGRYVRVATKFWTDEKTIDLEPEVKLLYLYILTSPHSNMAGYYRLPKAYIKADLQLLDKQLNKGFAKLLEKGLIKYCNKSCVILIPNYYKYNSIQNVNQAKGAANRTGELPKNMLVEDYKQVINTYADSYQKELYKGLPKGFNKEFGKRSGNTELELELETDTELETEKDHCSAEKKQNIPYKEIVKYLNSRTGSQYKSTTNKTQKLIKARWNEGFRLEDFETVIDKKCVEWMGDEEMEKYLRPPTLFSNKFESYLNQLSVANGKNNSKMSKVQKLYEEAEG
jgi:uncharacterized phage protein (TIGR02220 family)